MWETVPSELDTEPVRLRESEGVGVREAVTVGGEGVGVRVTVCEAREREKVVVGNKVTVALRVVE